MKALLVIVGLVLAAGAGAVGGALVAPTGSTKSAEALVPQAPASPAAAAISPQARERMDALSMEIADLQSQVAALKQERSREPAVAVTAAPQAAANESTEVFAALHRDAILKVVADERAEQERKRDEERKLREEQVLQAQADRVATQLNLSAGQKQLLVGFYANERQKQNELRTQARDTVDNGGAAPARDAFRDAREWRTNELTRLFGTELGAQIGEFDQNRRLGNQAGGGRRGNAGGGAVPVQPTGGGQ